MRKNTRQKGLLWRKREQKGGEEEREKVGRGIEGNKKEMERAG